MNTEFAIAEVMPDKLNALVENIMHQTGEADPNEAVRLVNSGEWVVSKQTHSWREEDGVIYFSVTSDGTTGEDWITRLESKGFCVGDYAKQVLRSPDFKPTNGVTTEVAVLKGRLFEDNDRITKKIRAEAYKRKLSKPNAELACLIREKFTDKEIEAMGLWYTLPCTNPSTTPTAIRTCCMRAVTTLVAGSTRYDRPGDRWHRDHGFALAVSQVSSQH